MSAKDIFHDFIKSSLEREGWTITDDPSLYQNSWDRTFYKFGKHLVLLVKLNIHNTGLSGKYIVVAQT